MPGRKYLALVSVFCLFALAPLSQVEAAGRKGRCANGQCTAPAQTSVKSSKAMKDVAPYTLGDTVIYVVPDGKYAGEKRVASIVWIDDNGKANLSVFKAKLRDGETADSEQPTFFVYGVKFCPEGTKGTFNVKSGSVCRCGPTLAPAATLPKQEACESVMRNGPVAKVKKVGRAVFGLLFGRR